MTKREISAMIDTVYRHCGQKETVIFCDRIMALGFYHAFKAGISFGKDDMVVPESKWKIVDETRELAKDFEQQYNDGLITQGEKYNKVVDAWSKCTDSDRRRDDEGNLVGEEGRPSGREAQVNSIYMMAHSGARGSPAQMRQLAGMRGLMAKPSGEIIETPIISNFKEGLSVLEYFNSTHGARKGLADTALEDRELGLSDAPSGRRGAGLHHHGGGLRHRRAASRCAPSSTRAPSWPRWPAAFSAAPRRRTSRIRPAARRSSSAARCWRSREVELITNAGVQELRIRSVLTCETTNGVCGACYGRDLARGTPVNMGEAVGVIAAQSIGEPGTQLTMRTFHIGGAAQISEQSFIELNFDGKVKFKSKNVAQELGRRGCRDGAQHGRRGGRSGRHRARASPHPVRRAHAGRGWRQDQARPAHRRVGSLHAADPDRGRRRCGIRRPGRRASRCRKRSTSRPASPSAWSSTGVPAPRATSRTCVRRW